MGFGPNHHPWPYPLLCLFWRLGLAGERLKPPTPHPPEGLLALSLHALEPPSISPPAASVAPPGQALLRYLLPKTPLGQMVRDSTQGIQALAALTRLLAPPQAGSTRRRALDLPPFWREALAPSLPKTGSVSVPTVTPAYDPLTWQLLDLFQDTWEQTGLTLVGPERWALYRVAGTRRMAHRFGVPRRRAMACGRTAYRIWRAWFETRERTRLQALGRLPLPPALERIVKSPVWLYRQRRHALRTSHFSEPSDGLPEAVSRLIETAAQTSMRSLAPRATEAWARLDLTGLTRALLLSPPALVLAAGHHSEDALLAAAAGTAQRIVRGLTAPWPWNPTPGRGRARRQPSAPGSGSVRRLRRHGPAPAQTHRDNKRS